MRLVTKTFAAALCLAATAVIAAEATDPTVRARQELMDGISVSAKLLGDMAGGKTAFDAAAAATAREALVAAAARIPAAFEPQASDPKSRAKPEIWTDSAGFAARAEALRSAAGALDTSSAETIKAGMGAVGGVCADCHKTYRSN